MICLGNGKEMSKARASIPNSPRKRKEIATVMAKEIGIGVGKARTGIMVKQEQP